MDRLYDISDAAVELNRYDGAAEKTAFMIRGERYLVKFGSENPVRRWPDQTSYTNTPANEYIGSHIFQAAGLEAQETYLCVFNGRACVACRDFVDEAGPGALLVSFRQLERSMPGESSESRPTPSLEFVSHVMDDHPMLAPLRERAWESYRETIGVDALIGNFDRHAGNWGYLSVDGGRSLARPAPVYDCGSSMYSQLSGKAMERLLSNEAEAERHALDRPPMCLTMGGKRLRYGEFLLSGAGKPFRDALAAVAAAADMADVEAVIDETPGIDEVHRDFYKQTLRIRKARIVDPAVALAAAEAGGPARARGGGPAAPAPSLQEGAASAKGRPGREGPSEDHSRCPGLHP